MVSAKKYKAKVLLFGEYTVLKGSNALAIPSSLFSGAWGFNEDLSKSQSILHELHDYLHELSFEKVIYQSAQFKADLDQYLVFDSSIPIGYGVGSSGAVCAAIFDQYFQKKQALQSQELQEILGQMESFFHGESSGLDPLISYLDQAILIQNAARKKVALPTADHAHVLFLLDTKISRRTAPLVHTFLKKYQSNLKFQQALEAELSTFNNQAIQEYLAGDWKALFRTIREISAFQLAHFVEMIPSYFHSIWKTGLNSGHFRLKLCGAGGGGFLLGISSHWETTQSTLTQLGIIAEQLKLIE